MGVQRENICLKWIKGANCTVTLNAPLISLLKWLLFSSQSVGYILEKQCMRAVLIKGHILANLGQSEAKTPQTSMYIESFWSVKMPKKVKRGIAKFRKVCRTQKVSERNTEGVKKLTKDLNGKWGKKYLYFIKTSSHY